MQCGIIRPILIGDRADLVTPFTPLSPDFGGIFKTRWFFVVRMNAMDAEVLYLQLKSYFPAGSIPVSRS
jgi:hypothetical protein